MCNKKKKTVLQIAEVLHNMLQSVYGVFTMEDTSQKHQCKEVNMPCATMGYA